MNDSTLLTSYDNHETTSTYSFASLAAEHEAPIAPGGEAGGGPGWGVRPSRHDERPVSPRVVVRRWRSLDDGAGEVRTTADDSHVVCIVLRRMHVRLSVSGAVIHDGVLTPGTLHIAGPGVRAEWRFRGAHDVLKLHISSELVAECAEAIQSPDQDLPDTLLRDPVIERLGQALLSAGELGGAFGAMYSDCLGAAIVSRLLALRSGATQAEARPGAGLLKWRLKRALDFIEAHLGDKIGLAEIATSAGLTRMHFAAQFRVTTGLRPHEYLLRRRIERAQEMLLRDDVPVVTVALEVGFQSQAHFTSVFKRFVGQPPHAWRRLLEPARSSAA